MGGLHVYSLCLFTSSNPCLNPQARGEFHNPPAHTSLACEAMAARALALGGEGARCQFWVGSWLFPANFEYTCCLD